MRRLSPEPGCQNNMLWRYELSETIPIEAFVTTLAERGWENQSKPNMPLFMLAHREGEHRLIVVKATRRIQLRLFYLTPREERVALSQTLGETFDAISEELATRDPA